MVAECTCHGHMPTEVGSCKAMSMSDNQVSKMDGGGAMHVNREVVARIPTAIGVFNLALYTNNKVRIRQLTLPFS